MVRGRAGAPAVEPVDAADVATTPAAAASATTRAQKRRYIWHDRTRARGAADGAAEGANRCDTAWYFDSASVSAYRRGRRTHAALLKMVSGEDACVICICVVPVLRATASSDAQSRSGPHWMAARHSSARCARGTPTDRRACVRICATPASSRPRSPTAGAAPRARAAVLLACAAVAAADYISLAAYVDGTCVGPPATTVVYLREYGARGPRGSAAGWARGRRTAPERRARAERRHAGCGGGSRAAAPRRRQRRRQWQRRRQCCMLAEERDSGAAGEARRRLRGEGSAAAER